MRRALPWLAVAALCAAAALARWRIADLADWGIDEAANLWLGSLILAGEAPTLGLVSSTGTPNLAGAPLLAAALARLPDLLAVSRVLSLLQLAALVALAMVLARGRGRTTAVATLAFCPAAVLASPSLWSQYLALPINAVITTVLVVLVDRPDENPRATGSDSAMLLVALLLLQPALHLAGFADLAAQGGLALALLGLRVRRVRQVGVELGVAIATAAAFFLYGPWLVRISGLAQRTVLAGYIAAAVAAVVAAAAIDGRLMPLARRVAEWRWLAWSVPLVLTACVGASALAFYGSQVGARLLIGDRAGTALLAAEIVLAAMALPALPAMFADCLAGHSVRELLGAWFGERAGAAAVLVANAGLLLVARAALVPAAFVSNGRPDLLLPLLPSLLAPSLLLAIAAAQPVLRAWAAVGAGIAATVVVAFAAVGPSQRFWQAYPFFLPPSEMRTLVDWLAAQPDAVGGDGRLDIGYDLGRDALVRVACSPITPWYTASRPFDWLFLRRHELRDRREGSCQRTGDGRYLVTYSAAPPPPARQLRLSLPHLSVWQ
ncbi:MAG TPA: hypothetical protein VL049_24425 [Candidatus Dormibacteraeota bacterium]|nr:hypothetical protein [Candidatus Dormibacteraeota bacterium]